MSRLDAIADKAERERPQALLELEAGEKRGHWVWWIFPTLFTRGGDANSACQRSVSGQKLGPTGADLVDADEARAYIAHPRLRPGLLDAFRAAELAMAAKQPQDAAPWRVLDKGFRGRDADGEWLDGPVDAYKCWCSATLFAAVGHATGDAEVRDASLRLLARFRGDVAYRPGGRGTAGHDPSAGGAQPRHVLTLDGDAATLVMVGVDRAEWKQVVAAAGHAQRTDPRTSTAGSQAKRCAVL